MSIYSTGHTLAIEYNDEFVSITEQVVGSHIRDRYDWLPPPRTEVSDDDSYIHPRAIVFVLNDEPKGGDGYAGQEYHRPLLVLSGADYEKMKWHEVMVILEQAVSDRALCLV